MQLNYFGCLRVTLGLLPGMVTKRSGHVVNISSIGVLTNAPRFSAYVASKAALDAWTRCAASEFADQGITFTTINMPLVRTPMIAPTRIYDSVPALDPEEAAALVVQACIERPVRLSTRLGVFGELLHTALPRVAQIIMNTSFRMFPENTKTDQSTGTSETELSAEALALQQMMKGLHF
jgi:NAD(P)-dependent dehydrogenase (short-subunit alcohol dehydrogenase family)